MGERRGSGPLQAGIHAPRSTGCTFKMGVGNGHQRPVGASGPGERNSDAIGHSHSLHRPAVGVIRESLRDQGGGELLTLLFHSPRPVQPAHRR